MWWWKRKLESSYYWRVVFGVVEVAEYLHGVLKGVELWRDLEAIGEEVGLKGGEGAMVQHSPFGQQKNGVDG
ncbi:hypothetical protein QJS10_CPA01g02261 [Acorus calamus]|uniref:Uncharacterized protein n=1 Tax=Acorus calamus TaxID=4465 RepID=A0AAV9FJD8_ACOCL|nr:hypothetical protein QJS10_CPA01g02261 [Acorus calamus]